MPSKPHYPLADIQAQMNCRAELAMTDRAQRDMLRLGHSKGDVLAVIRSLTANDFDKSMPSTIFAGCYQDVYKPNYRGLELYLKFSHDEDVDVPTIGDFVLVSYHD